MAILDIHEGGFYKTRDGQIVGPIEVTPSTEGLPGSDVPGRVPVWVWRVRKPSSGAQVEWLHWTSSGRWYQTPGQESSNDLIREASPEESALLRVMGASGSTSGVESNQTFYKGDPRIEVKGLTSTAPADPMAEFARVAEHWNAFGRNAFGNAWLVELSPAQVAFMLTLAELDEAEARSDDPKAWLKLVGRVTAIAQALATYVPPVK